MKQYFVHFLRQGWIETGNKIVFYWDPPVWWKNVSTGVILRRQAQSCLLEPQGRSVKVAEDIVHVQSVSKYKLIRATNLRYKNNSELMKTDFNTLLTNMIKI